MTSAELDGSIHDSVLERLKENEKQIRKKSNGNKKSTNLSSSVKNRKIIERLTIGDIFKLSENTKSPKPRTNEMNYFIKKCHIRIDSARSMEFHENHDCMKFFSIREYIIGEWICFTFDPLPALISNGSNDRIIEFPINDIISGGSGIVYQLQPGSNLQEHIYFKPIIHTDKNIPMISSRYASCSKLLESASDVRFVMKYQLLNVHFLGPPYTKLRCSRCPTR